MPGVANSTTASTKTFLSALTLNAAIAGGQIAAFTLVRRWRYFRFIYEPRSFSISKAKRPLPLSPRLLGWPISVFNADLDKIKDINGLDCYFFVRFLRMMVRVMLPIWLISWAVLIPLTTVHMKVPGHSGLDILIFGNIASNKQDRYAGHLLLTWLFTIWIWCNIRYEMKHYVQVRQEYLISKTHSSTAQACSVLVTGIPPEYLSRRSLTRLFDHLPGGVRQVWINRDLEDMPYLYERRLKACDLLESAGTSLLNIAVKGNERKQKEATKAGNKEHSIAGDPEAPRKTLLEELVPRQKRPSHRLPLFSWMPFSIPYVGKKVDAIEWARKEVIELTAQLKQGRESLAEKDITQTSAAEAKTTVRKHQIYPPANAAFILFNKQLAAHIAAQFLTHDEPYLMSASQKYIEVAPEDVIWDNLTMNNYNRRIRTVLSWATTIALILLWSIPVTFIGFISNIHSVCATYHWLHWVCRLPGTVVDFFQGFLPTALLWVLFKLAPIIMRKLARWEGIPQKTSVELSLMDRFFMFQVIIGFLIVTFSSGIIATLPDLVNHPTGVPSLLAQNLPKSSTFFLTFVVLQGLIETASGFFQIVSLVMYSVKNILSNSTPRSVYEAKYTHRTEDWGTLFPKVTQLVVITFAYSIISPIINCLACVAFFLFYLLYKYLFTWVNDQPPSSETGGLFFPKAINHIFVGLYIQQLCLCALFFLAQNDKNQPSAVSEGTLMLVLIIFTAFFHDTIRNSYGPLIKALPLTRVDSSCRRDESEDPAITDAPEPHPSSSENVKGIDYEGVSTHAPHQPVNEGVPPGSLLRDGANGKESSFSQLKKLVMREGADDFEHPVTAEKQRFIWLPKDPFGLVEEIEEDLKSDNILHCTEWATMDVKGRVHVKLVPEDAQDATKEE